MQMGPADRSEVLAAAEIVRDVCERLEPAAVGLQDVPEVFDAFVSMQRLAGGAVTRLAERYDESKAWQRNGSRSAEDDISRKTGTSKGRARRQLGTSKRVRNQSGTDDALRRGELSDEQADAVSSGADVSPEEEDELLDSARRDPLHELRKKAAGARARADKDREATRRRLHKLRSLRRWNDEEGMGNLLLRLPADAMAEVDAAMKRPIDRRFADARDAGKFESLENYAADVAKDLLTAAAGPAPKSGAGPTVGNQAVRPDKKVIARIDVRALNRGRVQGDELCEIDGVGPTSVAAVRSLLSDAFLALVFTDGVDVRNVTHLGRQVTAHQRTALEMRGGVCGMENCTSSHLLDIHHIEGWTLTYTTELDDLEWACWHCHDLATRHDLRMVGPPGKRRFVTRDGTPWGPSRAGPPDAGADPPDAGAASPGAHRRGADPPPAAPIQDDLFTVAR